ncbi:UDP-N-acetylmuramate dehydrogenase [[Brevibacterium] frigoritolerans]|nr:UDP-N-acetylmuramate dehydrogenase [Peribacillus frigoritolerans]
MTKELMYEELSQLLDKDIIKIDESLSKYSFTKTGGKADIIVFPTTFEEVSISYTYALEKRIPVTILGNGSNLIIRDGGIRGIVLILTQLSTVHLSGNKVIAQSGAAIIDVSRFALQHNLTGLEFACGIPGSIGGAMYMNAGAYGNEVSDVIEGIRALDSNGQLVHLSKEELELGYRTSSIPKKKLLVLEATFDLKVGEKEVIKNKMDELTFQRESKQPLEYPSCGSVFKRPPGMFAGKLIQDSGLQGVQVGGAQVSLKHAGFIVNVGKATATDYLELIEHIKTTVKSKFDVELETEVRVIGEDLPAV